MKTLAPTLIALSLASWGCTADAIGDGSGASRRVPDCAVEGFGTLPAGDEFDGVGAAIPDTDGVADGTWVHLGPETVVGGGGGSGHDDDGHDDDGDGHHGHGHHDHGHHDHGHDGHGHDGHDGHHDEPGEGCRGERRGHYEGRGEGHDRHHGRGRGHHCGCGDDDDGHGDDDHDDDDDGPATRRDRFEGTVDSVVCFINGSRVGTFAGSGSWNGESGYTFEVGVVDGGPTNDEYTFTVYDSSGGTVYTVNGFPDTGDLTVTEY